MPACSQKGISSAAEKTGVWDDVESMLKLTLPAEYKVIIDRYGDFQWGDFLYLLNPFSVNKYLNLHTQGEVILTAERQSRQAFPEYYPLPLYPEPDGLLPFLITDNGDVAFWVTKGRADRWPILLKGPRAPECELHFVSVGAFLYRFSLGTFHSLIFPVLADDDAD